ncbi:MAG: peptidoglycan editing factor PgeF [Maricaulaceae bacterium]|jgi:YfiH family protein
MARPPFHSAHALSGVPGLSHGFFGRAGGVSEGVFASLNTGPASGDTPEAVAENRARATRALGGAPAQLATLQQVHSNRVVVMRAQDDAPASKIAQAPWEEFPDVERPKADALVTNLPGLLVGVLTADCAPVLLADPETNVVAAAHAGWRGAFGGVIEKTVDAMVALGANRAAIRAAIGPCIHQTAYEVGPEFKDKFLADDPTTAPLFTDGAGDRSHFDLVGYVTRRIARAGVGEVEAINACTVENADAFFSRRATVTPEGSDFYGRNLSAIGVGV